ncbi:Cytochrome P450 [Geodermatophilus amargosae]|uniref:Cytochrome P450 n=1 Tax=Geodermatophilus amargosae TaxID=1296565 RepID=A0A1I7D7K6_9ACTN|nr:cytochrome P450 [Geodermatophilus amargosae]SFU07708.1 Cytochrome P450 [Geodermatophilus amargosae]
MRRLAEYQRLREECPVAWSDEHGGYWSLTRYADVREAARQPRTFASGAPIIAWPDFDNQIPISLNPPEHATYRRLLNRYVSKDAMARLEPTIRAFVVEDLDPLLAAGEGDIVTGLCQPLPARALAALLNLPDSAHVEFVEQFRGFERVGWDPEKINAVIGQMFESAVSEVVAERRARPLDPETDMLSGVLAAEIDGQPLSEETVVHIGVQMFVAGHATTADALATTMYRLATNPDIQMELRRRPEKIPTAVEEFLRIETPLQSIARTAVHDVELHGRTIRAGDRVALHYAAADLDPETFEHPSACIIERSPNPHLAFGAGAHLCYGAPLARLEMRLAMEEILARTSEIRLAGAGTETSGLMRGFTSLPLRFSTP